MFSAKVKSLKCIALCKYTQYWQPGHIRMEINKPIPGCSCRAAQLSVWKIGGVLLCVQWQSRDRSGMCPKQTTAILSSVVFRLHFVIKWRFVANTVSYILPAKRSGMVSTLPVDWNHLGLTTKAEHEKTSAVQLLLPGNHHSLSHVFILVLLLPSVYYFNRWNACPTRVICN